jgi:hypothetical protein
VLNALTALVDPALDADREVKLSRPSLGGEST